MRREKLDTMIRGWFVGSFRPSALVAAGVEVGVKKYQAGDRDVRHYHKIATEVTVVLSGSVRMNGEDLLAGDIIVLDPGEWAEFEALTDATTVVVKHPGACDDKYLT